LKTIVVAIDAVSVDKILAFTPLPNPSDILTTVLPHFSLS